MIHIHIQNIKLLEKIHQVGKLLVLQRNVHHKKKIQKKTFLKLKIIITKIKFHSKVKQKILKSNIKQNYVNIMK